MPPDKKRSGPLGPTPGSRPNDQVATTATATTDALRISRCGQDATANLPHLRQVRVTAVPLVFASVFAPAGRRKLWWFTYICAHCGLGHFGRADSEQAVNGRRHRGSCGRSVAIRVARVYRGQQTQAVAG